MYGRSPWSAMMKIMAKKMSPESICFSSLFFLFTGKSGVLFAFARCFSFFF